MDRIDLAKLIDAEAAAQGVDPDTLKKAIFLGENSAHKSAIPTNLVNPASGASGIGQVMPAVMNGLKKQGKIAADADIHDPQTNVRAAAMVLKDATNRYPENAAAQLAYYNGGWRQGDPVAAGKPAPAEETRKYLERTMGAGAGRGTDTSQVLGETPPGETVASGTVTRVTTKTHPDALPLADVTARFNTFSDANAKLFELMQAVVGDSAGANETERKAALNRGTTEAANVLAAGSNLAARKDRNTADANFLGINTADPQSRFVELQRQRMESVQVKDQLRGRIDAEDAVSIFDDPLRWAINQFTLPTLKNTFNAASRKEAAARQEIQANQQMASVQQSMDLGITGDMIRQSAAAEAQTKVATSLFEASKIAKEGVHLKAQLLMQQSALINSSQNSYMQLARMLDESTTRTEVAKADAHFLPALQAENLRRASVGVPPLTAQDLKLMNSAQKADLVKRTALAPGKLGASAGSTFLWLEETGADVAAHNPKLAEFFGAMMRSPEFAAEMNVRKQEPSFSKLSASQQAATVFDAIEQAQAIKLAKDGSYDKTDSTYKVKIGSAPLIPALAANPFTPEVKKLMDSKGLDGEIKHREIEGIALARVLSGAPVPVVAKELVEFYRTLQTEQWASSRAAAAGLNRPTELKTSTMFGRDGKQVNQWNPAAVEHWLMQQQIAVRSQHLSDSGAQQELGVTGAEYQQARLPVQSGVFNPNYNAKP